MYHFDVLYLNLKDFDHLRDVEVVRFREEIVNGRSVTIVVYMIADDTLWKTSLGTECRGITFDTETGELLSLPFEKFFNVDEKVWTQLSVIQDYSIESIVEKVDGSMITPAKIGGKIFFKTKKSFTSDVAILANTAANADPDFVDFCSRSLGALVCPIFEFTSPDSKIVINYGEKPQFTLLAIRDMITGAYAPYSEVRAIADANNIHVVKNFPGRASIKECMDEVESEEETEGWVIYTAEGRYKVKTKWYLERHRLLDVRERDIAGFAIDETLDDLIPELRLAQADMGAIAAIQEKVKNDILEIFGRIATLGDEAGRIPLGKERADWISANAGNLSKFVFRHAMGRGIDDDRVKDFYRQYYLKTFSLKSIGNPMFSG